MSSEHNKQYEHLENRYLGKFDQDWAWEGLWRAVKGTSYQKCRSARKYYRHRRTGNISLGNLLECGTWDCRYCALILRKKHYYRCARLVAEVNLIYLWRRCSYGAKRRERAIDRMSDNAHHIYVSRGGWESVLFTTEDPTQVQRQTGKPPKPEDIIIISNPEDKIATLAWALRLPGLRGVYPDRDWKLPKLPEEEEEVETAYAYLDAYPGEWLGAFAREKGLEYNDIHEELICPDNLTWEQLWKQFIDWIEKHKDS